MKQAIFNKYLKQMAAYCSRSEKCEFDVRKKLEGTELDINQVDELIDYLIENKYIDNSRFAEFFANDKFKFNKWGKQKIKMHLNQKQISSSIIQNALNTIDLKEYKKTLKEIIDKKRKSTKETDKYKLKEKIIRNALSKGFEMDLIYQVLE
jgi:regulatory protein